MRLDPEREAEAAADEALAERLDNPLGPDEPDLPTTRLLPEWEQALADNQVMLPCGCVAPCEGHDREEPDD